MTNDGGDKILNNNFDKLWSELWHNISGIKYRNEMKYSEINLIN